MGGTFDPIHLGHLVCADEARHAFGLDEVVFVPSGDPWQKSDSGVSNPQDRLEMTRLATSANDAFKVSDLEIERDGPTYTVDTLRALSGPELFFITGADAVNQILTWKDPAEVMSLATFIAATRPGHETSVPGAVELEIPALAISSTDIRTRVRQGRPFRYLVCDAVADYILEHRLYCE